MVVRIIVPLWNLTGPSATLLPRSLSNVIAIGPFKHQFRGFPTSRYLTIRFFHILKQGPDSRLPDLPRTYSFKPGIVMQYENVTQYDLCATERSHHGDCWHLGAYMIVTSHKSHHAARCSKCTNYVLWGREVGNPVGFFVIHGFACSGRHRSLTTLWVF